MMKMDIEGSEAECLEAILEAGLQDAIGAILVETHDRVSPDIARRVERIRQRIAQETSETSIWNGSDCAPSLPGNRRPQFA
ncbi:MULTISPECIES: hypothetical protein [unclassified Mesorhizobium]|uniref:hypothetical protein n=2 Tax=unclassified Mesorhizobium TaxID=325217 RepID=UPI0003CFCBB0|nr:MULTISPECIES: hypothetical protein [unclassified Mesorhizobium]ESZ04426.1 hypothetical protein X736_22180 [Mesorhizobium sp. L2C089B000]WJI52373.1 hypothetical protein NLY44_06785 [Mesorhizobium sp. C089B]